MGPVDLDDPQAETNLVLQLQMARQFWLQSKKRWRQSQEGAVKRGAFIGRCPLGYTRPKKGAPLEVDPVTAPIVVEAFRLAATQGMHAAMAYLSEHVPTRVVTRKDEAGDAQEVTVDCRWRTDEARLLLRSRAYLGEVRHGDLVNADAHPALVTLDVWTAAQTEPRARRRNGDYVLSGIPECGRCGGPIVGGLQTIRGRQYRRYRCSDCAGARSARSCWRGPSATSAARSGATSMMARHVVPDVTEAREALERAKAERSMLPKRVKFSDPDFPLWKADADAEVERARLAYEEVPRPSPAKPRSCRPPATSSKTRRSYCLRCGSSSPGSRSSPGAGTNASTSTSWSTISTMVPGRSRRRSSASASR